MLRDLPLHPPSASTFAGQVDGIYFFALVVSIVFSLLIAVLIVAFAVRYRRREGHEIGEPVHGSLWLEIGWSAIPFAIMMAMFFWGTKVFFTVIRPPADAVEYQVVAKRWMWKFQHPNGQREINDLHVPVGTPIRFKMTSEDVIHSLFFPAMRTKADVLPGRYTTLWFEATKPGSYYLFCAEYCGAEHSRMIGRVIVLLPHDYETWLSGGAGIKSPEARGSELFTAFACNSCHQDASTLRGPALAGLFGKPVALADGGRAVADDAYLRESILNPTAKLVAGYSPVMPTFRGQVNEDDLMQLIAYIKSLQPARGGAAAAATPQRAGFDGEMP